MSRTVRVLVCLAGLVGTAVLYLAAVLRMPEFGSAVHPLRDAVVAAAEQRQTVNAVSAVNYDQRALDTLVEETLLLGAVVGAAALLRPDQDERERTRVRDPETVLEVTRLVGYLLLPVTLLLGTSVVLHGALSPGGGFQGGVVLGTAVHLTYLAGDYPALRRVRPLAAATSGEAAGTAAFVAVGLAGIAAGGGFLANVLPTGSAGALLSAGTVPLLSAAVGVEVASGVVVLLAGFLEQALRGPDPAGSAGGRGPGDEAHR